MKILIQSCAFIILLVSCNHPGLNKEQREQLKEGKADRAIRKITEADILDAAKIEGESLLVNLTTPVDSVFGKHHAFWLYDSTKSDNAKFNEIREAYDYAREKSAPTPAYIELADNDSLLFAKPASFDNNLGVWFIYLNKKEIVRGIN